MSVADNARAFAAHCEVKLHGFRKVQEGVVVSFVLHPEQVPSMLALDPLGTRYMIALVPIGDDETPRDPAQPPVPVSPPQESKSPGPPSHSPAVGVSEADRRRRSAVARERYAHLSPPEQAVTHAALLAQDERFWPWADDHRILRVSDEKTAAEFIRLAIGAISRSEIATDPRIRENFLQLDTRYRMETGLMAEPR